MYKEGRVEHFARLNKYFIQRYERYLPTAFDESMTLLEKVNKVIEGLNTIVEHINDQSETLEEWQTDLLSDLDTTLDDYVEELTTLKQTYETFRQQILDDILPESTGNILNQWLNDGTLDDVINHSVFEGLNTRLLETTANVGDISLLGSTSRSVSESLIERGTNVKDFGAKGDGTTNDSQAFIDAVEHTEKGVVIIPEGQFIVEKLPLKEGLYYVGAGFNATILRSPSTPSGNMFETSENMSGISGGGIYGATLSGSNNSTKNPHNAIDFSTLNSLSRFTLKNIKVEFFNRGYNGTDNDRWAYITDAQFYNNDIGIYCGEHPILVNVDCRENDVALTGRINDLTALNCRFNYNRVGVEPHAGSPLGTYVSNSIFQNCGFFKNYEKAAELNDNNIVVGGRPSGSKDGDVGFVLTGIGNMVIGNSFSQNPATAFEHGAVKIIGQYNKVSNNKFNISGGPGIVTDKNLIMYNEISNNTAMTNRTATQTYPFFEAGEGDLLYLNTIKGNVIYVSGEVIRSVLSVPSTVSWGAGNTFQDNKVFVAGDSVVDSLLKLDLHNSMFVNNYLYIADNATVNEHIDIIRMDGQRLRVDGNVGFSYGEGGLPVYENSGEAVIPDGSNQVVIAHGLVEDPGNHVVQLTPRTDTSGYTWWVESATRTQFIIKRSTTEGVTKFNWRAEV